MRLSGQFEVLSANAGLDHHRARQGRAPAVRWRWARRARLESLPQVPTLAELGYPAANLSSQFGFSRTGQPAAAHPGAASTARINKALETPEVRNRLLASENVPTGGTAREFARQVAAGGPTTPRRSSRPWASRRTEGGRATRAGSG